MRRFAAAILGATVMLSASELESQIRASERGASIQTVDGTTITVEYSRPQVRGRTNLYGGEIPWGKRWTPGANWATTIEVSKSVTIDGHDLSAGKYGVWFEVQPDTWTLFLDPEYRRFHLSGPSNSDGVLSFPVTPHHVGDTEILTWEFSRISATGTTLSFAWADRGVDLEIGVEPSMPTTVAADMARPFTGSYSVSLEPALGGGESEIEVSYENGRLVARWPGFPNPHLHETWWVYRGAGMFSPAMVHDGELFDIITDVVFEFNGDSDASSFELRGPADSFWGAGTHN